MGIDCKEMTWYRGRNKLAWRETLIDLDFLMLISINHVFRQLGIELS